MTGYCLDVTNAEMTKAFLTAITHFAQQKAELIFDGNEIDTLIMSDQAILHS